jgi:glucan phosphoethanolaminetransferase (alkaline phosphatase superfamily)
MGVTDNINVNLNQNLWALVVSLATLGISEYFGLQTLYWFGFVLSIACSVSILFSIVAYTREYWNKKWNNN